MFDRIVQIRVEYYAGKGTLKDLRQQYGLNEKTYKRYVDKFRPQLDANGLLKPKRKPSNSSTTV